MCAIRLLGRQHLPTPVVPLPNQFRVTLKCSCRSQRLRPEVFPKALRPAKCRHTACGGHTSAGHNCDSRLGLQPVLVLRWKYQTWTFIVMASCYSVVALPLTLGDITMGFTHLKVFVSKSLDFTGGREVEFLVDTGAFYTMIPREILDEIGIAPAMYR